MNPGFRAYGQGHLQGDKHYAPRLSRAGARRRRCSSLRSGARSVVALQAAVKPEACLLRAVQVCAGTPGAAALALQAAVKPEACLLRAVQVCAGTLGAAALALQAAVKPEACLLRAVQVCAGTLGAAALSLASASQRTPAQPTRARSTAVSRVIGAAVGKLDAIHTRMPILQDLGRRHGAYGVQPQHCDTVAARCDIPWNRAWARRLQRKCAWPGHRCTESSPTQCSKPAGFQSQPG